MKKADVKDLESLEQYYDSVRKIRLGENVVIESLEDIYNNLFIKYDRHDAPRSATYYMRGGAHCNVGKYRSIEDFIKLSKQYFPDKKLKDIFKYLKEKQDKLDLNGSRQILAYCPNIRKFNYRGISGTRYNKDISTYNLSDLNPRVGNILVSELLT